MGISPAVILYDANSNPVSIIDDSGVYRLSGVTKVLDSGGSQVDPASEGTLATRASEATLATRASEVTLATRASEATLATRASEATLLTADGRLTTIDAVLDAIKDTDGIKKIVDIVSAQVAKGLTDLVHLDAIDTGAGRGRLEATLLTQAGDPVSFPSVSEAIKNDFIKNGANTSLLVDGSTTPVVFSYDADSTHDLALQEIRFTIAANSITFGTDYFGSRAGPLPNGLLVEVLVESGTVVLYNLVQNESFVNFSSPGGFQWVVSSKDMMTSDYVIGGGLILRAGTADKVRVTVRDNLTSAGIYFKCFVKGNLAAD